MVTNFECREIFALACKEFAESSKLIQKDELEVRLTEFIRIQYESRVVIIDQISERPEEETYMNHISE